MSGIYALLAALAFGAGDFLGGLAARNGHWSRVAVVAQAAGLALLILLAPIGQGWLTGADLGWSIAAGLGFGTGVCLLYRALAEGQMSVVAPITALCAIVLPSLYSMVAGHLPSAVAVFGIIASIPALALISFETAVPSPSSVPSPDKRKPVVPAIAAGIGIAAFYVCLKQTESTVGLWPVVVARAASTTLCGIYGMLHQRGWPTHSLTGRNLHVAIAAGVLDGAANGLLLTAVRQGDLAIVATLTSLYPAVTILLAWIILRERINKVQVIGICLAGIAAIAIAQAP